MKEPDKEDNPWASRYLHGVSGAEVEEIMWIKLPKVSVFRGYFKAEDSGPVFKDSLAGFIHGALTWSDTKEGSKFWNNHYMRALEVDAVEAVTKLREAKALLKEGSK